MSVPPHFANQYGSFLGRIMYVINDFQGVTGIFEVLRGIQVHLPRKDDFRTSDVSTHNTKIIFRETGCKSDIRKNVLRVTAINIGGLFV
jgi:hypothetical protein